MPLPVAFPSLVGLVDLPLPVPVGPISPLALVTLVTVPLLALGAALVLVGLTPPIRSLPRRVVAVAMPALALATPA